MTITQRDLSIFRMQVIEKKTLRETGAAHGGLSKERTRQISHTVGRKLRCQPEHELYDVAVKWLESERKPHLMVAATRMEVPLSDLYASTHVTVKDAMKLAVCGLTRLYELMAEGKIVAVKSGRRTLVTVASINDYLENLPKANFARRAA